MRAWLGLLSCVCLLAGCWSDSGKTGSAGSSKAAAAQALTKAVSFQGGQLLAGFVPDSSDSELVLMPAPAGSISPGDSALLGFDIDNANEDSDPSSMMLLQFEDTQQHFQVKLPAGSSGVDAGTGPSDSGVAAADASVPAGDSGKPAADSGSVMKPTTRMRHVELSYTVSADVCANLCDTTFSLKVTQAVRLKSKKIGAHATTMLTLDCTGHGNHALCASKSDTGGAGHVSNGSGCNSFAPSAGTTNSSSACLSCLNTSCPEFFTCYGPNWLQGDFTGGSCSALFECANRCGCDDTACQQSCATSNITGECSSCLATAGSCDTNSCAQACSGDGSSSGGAGVGVGTAGVGADVTPKDAGSGGGSAGGGGRSGRGDAGTPVPVGKSCSLLAQCCVSLSIDAGMSCLNVANTNSESECAAILPSFMSYCTGSAPAIDAGIGAGGSGG